MKPDDVVIAIGVVWCVAAVALIGLGVRLLIKSRRAPELPEPWQTWQATTGLWT